MKTVLITGGAQRIGAAIGRAMAADGWRVAVHYNGSRAAAEAVAAELGGVAVQADWGTRAGIVGLLPAVGSVACLVNNAARFVFDDIASVDWDSLHAHLRPNLVAPVLLSRAFAAQAPEGGCIVNLLDQKLRALTPDFLSYTLAKLGLAGLTEMLALALAPRIRVNGVAPGLTLISGKQSAASFERAWRSPPLGRSSTPGEIAACVRFILASPSMTGETITLDGGERLRPRGRDVAFDPKLLQGG